MKARRWGAVALCAGLLAALAGVAAGAQDDLSLVSRAGGVGGAKGNNPSSHPAVSADGRYVVFASQASNLTPDDTDTTYDVFVRDLQTNAITLVSRATGATGVKGDNASYEPVSSADGRRVAFLSTASNLDPADADTTGDVFVRDLEANTTTLVSRASGAKGDGVSGEPAISADGRYVAFESTATNLDPADGDSTRDVFLRDVEAGTTTLVSRDPGAKGNGPSYTPTVSADGRSVAFSSYASNLDAADPDTTADIFVRDLEANTTTLVSRAAGAAGAKGAGGSVEPALSADGDHVAFTSIAANLAPDDTDPTPDVFVRDVPAATTTLVSRAGAGKGNDSSGAPAISADGRSVAFVSNASNLDPADPDAIGDVFLRDLEANTTTLVSRAASAAGAKANGSSYTPAVSADGRFVAFGSYASNLDPADADKTLDVFARDVLGPPPPAAAPPPAPASATTPSPSAPPAPSAAVGPVALRLRVPDISVFARAGAAARCVTNGGQVGSCSVELRYGRRLVASGRAAGAAADQRTVTLRLTAAGRALLARRLGGVRVRADASAQTSGGARSASASTRALAAVEHVTTPPGSWPGGGAALTARGRRLVRGLRGRLLAVAAVRCDGYTARVADGGRDALALSRRRAALVCAALARQGVHARRTIVAHGARRPIAGNRTPAGRARNDRVEITVTHRPRQP